MIVNILLATGILWVFSWLFVKADNLVDEAIDLFKRKVLKRKRKLITRSSGDIFKDLKNSNLRDKYLRIYRFFLHIAEFPMDAYRETKWFIQRGKQGYSDCDVWGFDYYLTNVIIGGLKQLQKNKHGYPITIIDEKYLDKDGNTTEEGDKVNQENWDRILSTMIQTFETAKKIENDYWYYQSTNAYSEKRANKYRKFQHELRTEKPDLYEENFGYVMTKAECKQYEEGWKYFQKYFFNLWD